MKGDFTRFTFDPKKRYSGVLKQQGRVDLDADWNEQGDIQRYHDRTVIGDVVGPNGAPTEGAGFKIERAGGQSMDFQLSAGRIYVNGILCEADESFSYGKQPHLPAPPALKSPRETGVRKDLVYLDVWERHVTVIEDPALREVALGGPDTTTRVQTVWQVKVREGVEDAPCGDGLPGLGAESDAGLTTGQVELSQPVEPCSFAPAGGYRGIDNRLYRVEIHTGGGAGKATFKWSRDNGAVVFPVEERLGEGTRLQLGGLGRDGIQALRSGDWVEFLDDGYELAEEPGVLAQVIEVDESERTIELSQAIPARDFASPKVRRWDQPSDAVRVADGWMELEDGIRVQFSGSDFSSGDYWMFAARTVNGEVAKLDGERPHGTNHHYIPLGLVTWKRAENRIEAEIRDCRPRFMPLSGLTSLHYVGGDSQAALPGQRLPRPLEVRVLRGGVAAVGAKVRFVTEDGGVLSCLPAPPQSETEISVTDVLTDQRGIARVCWWLDDDAEKPNQRVTATLEEVGGTPLFAAGNNNPHVVHFNGRLSLAREVFFEPNECLPDSKTVQTAIEELCRRQRRPQAVEQERFRVTGVFVGSEPLQNDSLIGLKALDNGIRVVCSDIIDHRSVNDKPVCAVALDLPYPNAPGTDIAVQLRGAVRAQGGEIQWNAMDGGVSGAFPDGIRGRTLARLTVHGNFIWAYAGQRLLDRLRNLAKPSAVETEESRRVRETASLLRVFVEKVQSTPEAGETSVTINGMSFARTDVEEIVGELAAWVGERDLDDLRQDLFEYARLSAASENAEESIRRFQEAIRRPLALQGDRLERLKKIATATVDAGSSIVKAGARALVTLVKAYERTTTSEALVRVGGELGAISRRELQEALGPFLAGVDRELAAAAAQPSEREMVSMKERLSELFHNQPVEAIGPQSFVNLSTLVREPIQGRAEPSRQTPGGTATPLRYLDAEVFGRPPRSPFPFEGMPTHVTFPSGDGRRGGTLEMWFWVVP
jgi:hypothetical protein